MIDHTARAPRLLAGALMTVGALSAPAYAQDDGMSMSFDLNSVLVATFEAEQPFLEPEAERVRDLVEDALGQAYVVVTMAEVPAFTDYSADIYLRSCPQGQYIGCVFVVGGRAQTDWSVGGRVSAVEGGFQVDLSFIDVSDAKLVLEFDVVLDGSNDGEFKDGVIQIMDALVDGEVQDLDLRGDPEARRAAEAEADKRERMAQDFAADSIYEELGDDVERGDVGLDAYVGDSGGSSGRVTFEDLEEMEEAGGLTPWERAGLTKSQYRLYRNSGIKLRDFKARMQGRKGEIHITASMQVGSGPWGQQADTWYVQDNQANPNNIRRADILAERSILTNTTQLSLGGQVEIAFGLARWLELGLFAGVRGGPYEYRFYKEIEGVGANVPDFERRAVSGFMGGLKLGFIPMPAYPVRPRIHVGAAYWRGTNLQRVVEVPGYFTASQFLPVHAIIAQVQPGLEVSAGKMVLLWAKFDLDAVVTDFGRFVDYRDGDQSLFVNTPPDFPPIQRFGYGGSLGITIRIRYAGLR